MRPEALSWLGLGGQDWGPCYTDEWTHAEFEAAWRGAVPCPTEAALIEAGALALTGRDVEIKRKLLAEAMIKRDGLLVHLRWFFSKAERETRAAQAALDAAVGEVEQAAAQLVVNAAMAKEAAIDAAITSMENILNEPRVVAAVDGDVKPVLKTVNKEIGVALATASPETYYALLALDAL